GNKNLVRDFFAQAMQQTSFSDYNDFTRWRFSAKSHHFFGGTNFISKHTHGVSAFRMSYNRSIRKLLPNLVNASRCKLDVDVTVALPQIHLASRSFNHPRSEILIGNEKNIPISRSGAHDLVGIPTGANHVGQRLHAGAAIDVSDDIIILVRVLFKKLLQLFWRNRL